MSAYLIINSRPLLPAEFHAIPITCQENVAPLAPGSARTLMVNWVEVMVLTQKFPGSLVGLLVGVTWIIAAVGVRESPCVTAMLVAPLAIVAVPVPSGL